MNSTIPIGINGLLRDTSDKNISLHIFTDKKMNGILFTIWLGQRF